MLNLNNLLKKILETISSQRSAYAITGDSVSLSSRYNYLVRFNNTVLKYRSSLNDDNKKIDKYYSTVYTDTITDVNGNTNTLYYWFERSVVAYNSYSTTGLYLMYNGGYTTPSTISSSGGAYYCYFDIALPQALSTYINEGTSAEEGIIFSSMTNYRVLGIHGRFSKTSTLRLYVYLTTSTVMSTESSINIFAYIPLRNVNTRIK